MSDIEDLINRLPGLFEDGHRLPNGRFYPSSAVRARDQVSRRREAVFLALNHSRADVYLFELFEGFMIVTHDGSQFIRLYYTYEDGSCSILASGQEVVEQRLITKEDGRQVRRWCPPHEPEPDDTVGYIVL